MCFSSIVMLMRGGYFRLKNLTHRNSQTLAALPKIADLLGVSLCTIRRRMDEYGLSESHFHSSISDHELLRVMKDIYSSFPNCGYRIMDGHLRRCGI